MDAALHATIVRAFPRAIPVFDGLLESVFGVVTHAAFALIAPLLLGVLVITGVIKAIVFWSIAFAWIVAILWIARAERVRKLTVTFRSIFVGVIGTALAVAGNGFGRWALDAYSRQKAAERSVSYAPKEELNNGNPKSEQKPQMEAPSVNLIPKAEPPKDTKVGRVQPKAPKSDTVPPTPPSDQTKTVRSGPPESLPKPPEQPHAEQTPAKTTYQGFTESSPDVLSMGGIHVLDLGLVAGGQIRTPWGQEIPVRCHLKNSNLYCDADLWSEFGTAVSVRDNVFTILVPTWDRNFTDDALEVVNEQGQPVLQIIRRTPSHWEVNGVFTKLNGEVCVVTENQILFAFLGPNLTPEQRQSNEMSVHSAEAEIKPIFKYPSYQHRGEFASQ